MKYTEIVEILKTRIEAKTRELRKSGVVSMSQGNLRALVSTSGLSMANANVYMRAFAEALNLAKKAINVSY